MILAVPASAAPTVAPVQRPGPDPLLLPSAPPEDTPELSPAPRRPGPVQRWTLATVLQAVGTRHPRIAALQAERGVVDARVLAARASIPNPSILSDNGTAEYTYRLGFSRSWAKKASM